jgi:DNA-directed RNA polymerase specialized sigma24 family protein
MIFMQLLNDYSFLFEYAGMKVRDKNDINELVQTTLIECWRKGANYDNAGGAMKILDSVFINDIRRKRKDRVLVELNYKEDYRQDFYSVQKHIEARETLTEVFNLIKEKCRVKESYHAYILYKFYNYSFAQIADMMGINANDVNGKVSRINIIIKKHFNIKSKENKPFNYNLYHKIYQKPYIANKRFIKTL